MRMLSAGANLENVTFPISKEVNEQLPRGVDIHIEKKVPYLVVCRQSGEKVKRIISNESSYILAPEEADELIKETAMALANEFGSFILIELWINESNLDTFHISFPQNKAPATIDALEDGLSQLKQHLPNLKIQRDPVAKRCPENTLEFFTTQECKKTGILKMGIEIPQIFNDKATGAERPVFFRYFRQLFSKTLKKSIYEFLRVQTSMGIENYQLLGRKQLNKAVWEVDRELAEIEKLYEFLLLIAPANSDESWKEFKEAGYNENPRFHYRLLPLDPEKLKKRLYQIDIEAVDDPSMAYLFREKREELDTQITMLNERGSRSFMFSSVRLFSSIDDQLLKTARNILKNVYPEEKEEKELVDCHYFADKARREIAFYKAQNEAFSSGVEVRNDMVGIMVSKGRVLIGKHFELGKDRVDPLLQHEVGTHVLTYCNGSLQPLQLLRSGLAGYDELQEGLAVLSEYLVEGLTANRLRILAARVTAAHDMTEGAEFKDVYNELTNIHSFSPATAYDLTTRIYQSGGYTKDIIYLRGLLRLIEYLEAGGDLDILYIGKIAERHIPIIRELRDRQVLNEVPLFPSYLHNKKCLERLAKVREGITPEELVTI